MPPPRRRSDPSRRDSFALSDPDAGGGAICEPPGSSSSAAGGRSVLRPLCRSGVQNQEQKRTKTGVNGRCQVEVTSALVRERPDLKPYENRKLTVIAWLWARTVKSPNPAFADVDVPLASTFMLSTKKGKEAYVEPVI